MDFLDPEEEYELMHADEFEMMREMEDDFEPPDTKYPAPKSKKSLDFSERDASKGGLLDLKTSLNDSATASSEVENCNESCNKENNAPITCSGGIQPLDSHKRTVHDLFGDIEDIDFDSVQDSKRMKMDELSESEKQNLMIEKILKMRKEMNEIKMHPALIKINKPQKKVEEYITRGVPKWPFMPVTDAKGQRLYLRLHTEEYIENEIKNIAATKKGGLLSVPYVKLRQLALEEMAKRTKDNPKENNTMDVDIIDNGVEKKGDLLVERYKPKSYLQLLSDEGTNRLLLQWLKLWDKLVFNREKRVKSKGKVQVTNNKYKLPALSEDLDEHHRPQFKIALLCGPPGLGKTTLAHMIAKQAGYNVVEVNASDDRSPDLFRTQLEAATQMRAVMGADPRPNCLVLDEIDGAPLASIEVVVKFATDKNVGKKSKTKKQLTGLLRRPIICICNDVYVPALRPLRQIAFTLHFPPTSSARLGERLMEICYLEDVKTDLGAMMALSEKTGNDIRACLQALQCLRMSDRVTLTQIKATKLGVKDTQLGFFSVWNKVFQRTDKPSSKGEVDSVRTFKSQIADVVRAVQSCGEFDRLVQGVHENFPNNKFRDMGMTSVSEGLNWFCIFDLISTNIQATQSYVLYPYLPYAFGAWHLLFSSRMWPKLVYPSAGYEMFQRQNKCTQQLSFTMHGMQPQVRACMQKDQLLLDSIPYLLEVIVPNIRPVNAQLHTPKEKEELAHVVNVLIDYNLNYTQERTQDGSFVYNLDPNLEEIGRFKEVDGVKRSMSYAGRQMLSREVETERLRRAEAILNRNKCTETNKVQEVDKKRTNMDKEAISDKSEPNFLKKLTPKALKKKPQMEARDFFGRIVESSLTAVQEKAKMDDIVKSTVWFHFKEGYNNAVRRNILMKDLY